MCLLQLNCKSPYLAHLVGVWQNLIVPLHLVLKQIPFGLSVFPIIGLRILACSVQCLQLLPSGRSTDVCVGTTQVDKCAAWRPILDMSGVSYPVLFDAAVSE